VPKCVFSPELDRLDEINFRDDGEIRGVEDGRVLGRLVLALGDGEEHDAQVFAEVIARRADEIPNVLDEQEIQFGEIPLVDRPIDHLRVKVAHGAGCDLSNGDTGSP
jgi:hypothetical protein